MKRKQEGKLKEPPLQPLRTPTGWLVQWNTFFDVEPNFGSYDQISWNFGEDMLLVSNERVGIAIALGWHPAYRSPGMFQMVAARIYEDEDKSIASWDAPLRKLRTRSREKIVGTLERWMEWYGNQKSRSQKKR